MSFFRSRWVEVPEGVTELSPDAGLPVGFRAAGVAAGLKPSGARDVGLLVSDAPETTSAARFTRSGVLAAPVLVTQERARLDALRVIVANSGNANAATGGRGIDAAAKMQGAAAMAGGVEADRVAVASTGVIGVPLDDRAVVSGLARARGELRPDGDGDLAAAIMTTDACEKRANLDVELPGGTVRLCAQAKGAGMIQPSFATMLCFVQTDAILSPETADLLLGVCVKRSFDRISVDGQLSTNDTAILMAGGLSGVTVEPESESEARFGQALDALLRQLALDIVRDGEGAARVGRVVVRGGHADSVERTARAVANSPLVKAALHGGDPNWGRIAQAVGMALPGTAPLALDIAIEGTQVCSGGSAIPYDERELAERVRRDE
ncbi:MAG: argJ, partial [Solirubrobacterales bacterium]|nr:argJ [Solirubrobacterales bacterium]